MLSTKEPFAQFGIQEGQVAENFSKRLRMEQFQECVLRLDDDGPPFSRLCDLRSNHRMILYNN
jgi:hypothetical protein